MSTDTLSAAERERGAAGLAAAARRPLAEDECLAFSAAAPVDHPDQWEEEAAAAAARRPLADEGEEAAGEDRLGREDHPVANANVGCAPSPELQNLHAPEDRGF